MFSFLAFFFCCCHRNVELNLFNLCALTNVIVFIFVVDLVFGGK